MLAVHWSPVKNTKHILRNGIRKSKRGLFCFPLTGQPNVDKWWANAFRQWRPRTPYNGFVFRVVEDDLPAAFSHWLHGGLQGEGNKQLHSLAEIQAEWESTVMFRIGEAHFGYNLESSINHGDEYESKGREIVAQNPDTYMNVLDGDPRFLQFIFEDYELVLSRSISPNRILHVLSGHNDYGRNIVRAKKEKAFKTRIHDFD